MGMEREPGWEHFSHGADIGVRGVGATKAEAFEQAALALTAVIADPGLVAPLEAIAVECAAPDDELLFADWLNALIYEMGRRAACSSAASRCGSREGASTPALGAAVWRLV